MKLIANETDMYIHFTHIKYDNRWSGKLLCGRIYYQTFARWMCFNEISWPDAMNVKIECSVNFKLFWREIQNY